NRMLVVGGRHELGLPHGAGPGADHTLAGYVTVLQNLQRGQQLNPPEALAATVVSQRREGADHAVAADVVAEVAFKAPDGHQNPRIDTILLFDALQHAIVLCQQDATAANTAGGNGAVEIFPYRPGEFGLTAVSLQYCRVGGDAGEYAIEQRSIDTGGNRFAAQRLTPIGEAGQRRFGRGLNRSRRHCGGQVLRRRLGAGRQQKERKQSQGATRKLVWHVYLKAFKHAATLACPDRILGDLRSDEAHKARSLPIVGGFAAVAAFAFLWSFLAGTKQWLGDDGFGLVRPFAGFLAHGVSSCECLRQCRRRGLCAAVQKMSRWCPAQALLRRATRRNRITDSDAAADRPVAASAAPVHSTDRRAPGP